MHVIMGVAVMIPMVMPVVMAMSRPMIMPHRAPMAIGATLGRECAAQGRDRGPQLAQHRGQNMIIADQQMIIADLAGRMAIADMPSQAHEIARHPQKRLIGGGNRDQAAVECLKRIACRKRGGFGQIDQNRGTRGHDQTLAAQEPPFVIEHQLIRSRSLPLSRRSACLCDDRLGHSQIPHQQRRAKKLRLNT